VCEYTDQRIDLTVGHCVAANSVVDRTHTHCTYCGSGDECLHLFAFWDDDAGYNGPDIPLVPEDWNVPADWSKEDLQHALGNLLAAFEQYADLDGGYEDYVRSQVFRELAWLLDADFQVVDWCSDGRPVSIGETFYAADVVAAKQELGVLTSRLEAVRARLGGLRSSTVVVAPEVEA
jgi:hypothetical protein